MHYPKNTQHGLRTTNRDGSEQKPWLFFTILRNNPSWACRDRRKRIATSSSKIIGFLIWYLTAHHMVVSL